MNNLTFPQLSQNTKGQLSLPKIPEIPLVYHVPSKVREKPDLNLAAGAQALRWQSGHRCRRHHTWLAAIGLRRRGGGKKTADFQHRKPRTIVQHVDGCLKIGLLRLIFSFHQLPFKGCFWKVVIALSSTGHLEGVQQMAQWQLVAAGSS